MTAPVRRRDEGGMIGITALGLMLLLMGISTVIFLNVATTVHTTRAGLDFVDSRHQLDTALADAEHTLLTLPTNADDLPAAGDWTAAGSAPAAGTWTWTRTLDDPTGTGDWRYGGTVTAAADQGDSRQQATLEWRRRYVGSVLPGDRVTYGIAAPSAWTATVATVDDSHLAGGSLAGDWHLYGPGKVTLAEDVTVDPTSARALAYFPGATLEDADPDLAADLPLRRSAIAAVLDQRLLNERVAGCGPTLTDLTIPTGPLASPQPLCGYHLIIDQPVTVVGDVTLVAYGNVTISADIDTTGGTLRIYTAGGSVAFRGDTTPTLGATASGFYLYAPNALCKTYGTTSVNLTGSLACRQARLRGQFQPADTLPHEAGTETGAATKTFTYLEATGYTDRFKD